MTEVGSSPPMEQETFNTSSAERFKLAFSYKDVRVLFVGAWYVIPSAFMAPRTLTIRVSGILSHPSGLHAERRCSLERSTG